MMPHVIIMFEKLYELMGNAMFGHLSKFKEVRELIDKWNYYQKIIDHVEYRNNNKHLVCFILYKTMIIVFFLYIINYFYTQFINLK